ncbi:MAG: cysteine hydrolase, partial [Anaerolineales bacterium]|nr:cysteine hydrolase [Anaerolineales bacterium]
YFLTPSSHAFIPSAPAVLPGLNRLIRAYSQRGLPVFLSRHLNTPENAGLMASWWRELITPANPLSELDPRLEREGSIELQKTRYDAFFDTPLETLLRERGVEQVVIGGVMTHLCCETTARSAFMRGFQVFFLVDGTATYTEAFHRASLLTLTHGFAVPVLVGDILEALEDA